VAESPQNQSANRRPMLFVVSLAALLVTPYGLLLLLSLGSGWTFPNLRPDRMDFAPWKSILADRDGLLRAMATSAGISLIVATFATVMGLLIGRSLRQRQSPLWRILIYLPFVVSPVIAATSLYDLLVRMRLAGTLTGVVAVQVLFATSFCAVISFELWNRRTDRLESLVRSFGGNSVAVWRHVILPECRGLIGVCIVQSALYSWLDYGLVSVIGGGHVVTLTTKLFGYIREASVNQAAMSSIVLMTPVIIGLSFVGFGTLFRSFRSRTMLEEP